MAVLSAPITTARLGRNTWQIHVRALADGGDALAADRPAG